MPKGYCFMCGEYGALERHHLFGGARRPISDRYGLTVDLCYWCHQGNPDSAHQSGETKLMLHKYGEMKAIREQGWTVEEFMERFGKNYLEEDEIELAYEGAMAWEEETDCHAALAMTGSFQIIEEEGLPF